MLSGDDPSPIIVSLSELESKGQGKSNNIWTMDTADDEMFKRKVEKMGIKCSLMKYGDEINV